MIHMTKGALAIANYIVCALNLMSWTKSHDARDFWAFVAWFGSGTFWTVQAILG